MSNWLAWAISFGLLALAATAAFRKPSVLLAASGAGIVVIGSSLAWSGGRSILLVMVLPIVLTLLPLLRGARFVAVIAGVLALAVHGAGMLGKFFAEAIEDIDEGPIEAFRSAGVGRIKTILFGIVPQVLPAWLGTIFYRLETNVRQATVLGMVGAGGIGFELVSSMKLFQYQDTAMCIIVILGMVLLADLFSSRIRAMIR